MIDFTKYSSSMLSYSGDAGMKKGIIIDGENWFIKFPQKTDTFRNMEISYTTSPLSEYLGSHIYESLNISTHQTILGKYNGKVVVACKDFRNDGEELIEFSAIKNEYSEELESINISPSLHGTSLSSIMAIMNDNKYFVLLPRLRSHFWDMFIVDALIGNNDRNNNNWGVLRGHIKNTLRIAPVYDNGASFSNKLSDRQIEKLLKFEDRFIQSVFSSRTCHFCDDNGKYINPLQFIKTSNNQDLISSLKQIVPRINLLQFQEIITSLPNEENGLLVISDQMKEFYYKTLAYRYEKILLPRFLELTTHNKHKSQYELDER